MRASRSRSRGQVGVAIGRIVSRSIEREGAERAGQAGEVAIDVLQGGCGDPGDDGAARAARSRARAGTSSWRRRGRRFRVRAARHCALGSGESIFSSRAWARWCSTSTSRSLALMRRQGGMNRRRKRNRRCRPDRCGDGKGDGIRPQLGLAQKHKILGGEQRCSRQADGVIAQGARAAVVFL